MANNRSTSLIRLVLFLGILLLVNILAARFLPYKIDLTEEKRFTLTKNTKKLLKRLDDKVYVEVYLGGDYPADYKRLQNSVKDLLDDFRSVSKDVEYRFVDPLDGSEEQKKNMHDNLVEWGILPVEVPLSGSNEFGVKLMYPGAILRFKGREYPVVIMKRQGMRSPDQEMISKSINLLEFNFANAISKLNLKLRKNILFTTGHGEATRAETADVERTLQESYNTSRIDLDSVPHIRKEVHMLIVAQPKVAFTEREKFKIDQYVMNGGKVVFFIDKLNVALDSLARREFYVPPEYALNLDDLLFRYGARIQGNILQDLRASRIMVGVDGNKLRPWYYHPVAFPNSDHPIVKNLDGVQFKFTSSIDTVRTTTNVEKTILLSTSEYTRAQPQMTRVSLESAKVEGKPERFTKSFLPLAVMLEGNFSSLYKNRTSQGMIDTLAQLGMPFKEQSTRTQVLLISDGDVIKNRVDYRNNQIMPLGYDRNEKYTFANKEFIQNIVEYLLDDSGIIAARNKEIKLRLLNRTKAKEEKLKWQLINLVMPLVFLSIFGFLYFYMRKRRYG